MSLTEFYNTIKGDKQYVTDMEDIVTIKKLITKRAQRGAKKSEVCIRNREPFSESVLNQFKDAGFTVDVIGSTYIFSW